ncbi:MAG: hydantoinase/oxoprolinase family protein [Gammaproteobacteria bacterium]|nr:hydantoinase/oxoprolinase family protein [Gammaproteobacteria bacterium]
MNFVGIDTGGTFTDFVCLTPDGALRIHKVLSTPRAPEQAILQGIGELGLDGRALFIVHGSTVATNAVLEGKGVRTVFITNHGLRDLLAIGRQVRRALYDLQPPPEAPPVPRELCLETGGRLGAHGEVVTPLTAADLAGLRAAVDRLAPRAVAINLLFSFLDERFEREVAAAMPAGVFVSRSSAVLPEYKEYERGVATWLNASVGPLVEDYLNRLTRALPAARISVMQSSGDTIAAAQAGAQAVRLLLSGPAGGLAAVRRLGADSGHHRLLSFDMGGTSTDVALIDGTPRLSGEGRIGGYPVAVPMVDMHTIGAGGGSIAWLDEGGLLRVGPASAGADPGPACYGRGGRAPTVTDANLALGRLPADGLLGGRMRLDRAAAVQALARVAEPLGLGIAEAAAGIVRIADEHMAQALRVISVQRGIDPRGHTLASFGGAGGLHVCALAEALGITRALVPVHAGVLSALGMLVAPRGRQLSRSVARPLRECSAADIERGLGELVARGRAELQEEGVAESEIAVTRTLDLRYQGQSHGLNVAWEDLARCAAAFHELHRLRYGHRLELPLELVNLRAGLRAPAPDLPLTPPPAPPHPAAPRVHADLHGGANGTAVYARAELAHGQRVAGPALITETVATTYLAPGWSGLHDERGNLLLTRDAGPAAVPLTAGD